MDERRLEKKSFQLFHGYLIVDLKCMIRHFDPTKKKKTNNYKQQ